MIVRMQGEVTLRSCPYSQSKGSNSEGNYQLVEFVACSPSQVQNPTFLSTIHHRSSLPFLIRSSRFIKMENWAMAGSVRRRMECGIQLSCMQTVSDWEENMAKFPASIQWSQVQGEGRNAACCKYKPGSYLAEECRMPQFLHLYHQGRGHSPCHHQLQRSSEWTRQRTDIII